MSPEEEESLMMDFVDTSKINGQEIMLYKMIDFKAILKKTVSMISSHIQSCKEFLQS